MPTYDYCCIHCHTQFEAHHPVTGTPPDCPACGGQTEKVILAAPAIHGYMARGRELAMRSLAPKAGANEHVHGPGCGCCARHTD